MNNMKKLNQYISEAERAFGITKYISEAERIPCLHGYITEKFRLSKDCLEEPEYHYHPKTRNELEKLVKKLIEERGDDADLNDIDTSEIDDMSFMFCKSEFNGNISHWNTSKVKNMMNMFIYSKFNGDISEWDVSNVENMIDMFYGSKFNQDIENWEVNSNCETTMMFAHCPLKITPPAWYKE